MSNRGYTTKQFIEAIPGTGGIISAIAKRIGCSWHTAKRYVTDYATVKEAYEAELEANLDLAESVLRQNILLAYEQQTKDHKIVDTSDVKWLLARLGKNRGYSERTEQQSLNLDMSQLTLEQLERIAKGEDVYSVLATSGHS